jgi:hypothetical protein
LIVSALPSASGNDRRETVHELGLGLLDDAAGF